MSLRIAAYVSPLTAYPTPTGVGQHILGMLFGLQKYHDIKLSVVTPMDRIDDAHRLIQDGRADAAHIPLNDLWLRAAACVTPTINVDRWLRGVDWVYSPLEQPLATRRRLAVTIHDLFAFERYVDGVRVQKLASVSWRLRMRRIVARADVIATVSEFTKDRLLELFDVRDSSRIHVIGNGGAEGFDDKRRSSDEATLASHRLLERQYVLFPASLTWRKGGDLLLDVARLAAQRRTGLCFVVIGRRHDRVLLARLRQETGTLPSQVRLLGYLPKADLAVLYRHAFATLFPSRYEGFGIPVVEALASGCPLVISRQAALIEVARGRATVVERHADPILDALLRVGGERQRAETECLPTWASCVDRLLLAMGGCASRSAPLAIGKMREPVLSDTTDGMTEA